MKKLSVLFLLVFSSNLLAFEGYNFSFIFGSANLTNDEGVETYGGGLSLRGELFVQRDWGMLLSMGSTQTESDELVANNKSQYEYNTFSTSFGGFLYFAEYFRLAAGLGLAQISETYYESANVSTETDYSKLGPFYEIGFKYPLRPMVIGVDYIYQQYDDFTQSGFFFMLGFVF